MAAPGRAGRCPGARRRVRAQLGPVHGSDPGGRARPGQHQRRPPGLAGRRARRGLRAGPGAALHPHRGRARPGRPGVGVAAPPPAHDPAGRRRHARAGRPAHGHRVCGRASTPGCRASWSTGSGCRCEHPHRRPRRRRPAAPGPARVAALDVAPAHQHAHRAVPAAAARDRRHPGVDLPAALDQRGPHRPVHRRPPGCRPGARPARVLRGLRLAVVRRDLPAAVRLAHRLRPAPHAHPVAPGAFGPAPCPAPPRPARRARRAERRRRTRRGARAPAHRPARPPLPRARPRRRDPLGREGLPARDRQPGLPRGADRRARRGRVGPPSRLEG